MEGRLSPPPPSNRGGNESSGGVVSTAVAGIDGFRLVHDDADEVASMAVWLTDRGCGHVVKKMSPGRHRYSETLVYTSGVELHVGHESNGGCLVIPGRVASYLGGQEGARWLAALIGRGWRATRVDVCLDFYGGSAAGLIERLGEACDAGEVTGRRRYRPVADRAVGGAWRGETLYLGLRGKAGSGTFVRVYDKGLEQDAATRERGDWVRLELEASAECAELAVRAIVQAYVVARDLRAVLVGLALGSFDVRQVTGQKAHARRPRVRWWAEFCGMAERVKVIAKQSKATFEGWRRWMRGQVMPTLRDLAKRASCSVVDLLQLVELETSPIMKPKPGPVAWEFHKLHGGLAP